MSISDESKIDSVLILAPANNDAEMAAAVLAEAGIGSRICRSLDELVGELSRPYGSIVVTEEGLAEANLSRLQDALAAQESWSDIPFILLSSTAGIWATELFARGGNISLLERPFSRLTFVRAVEVALRARRRQYAVRAIIEQQAHAAQKRDEFFATLSHELRTPLNVILGWVELLRAGKLDDGAREQAFEILERNANTQKGLIDDLLDVSRIITGKLIFEPVLLSMSDLLRSSVAGFLPRAKDKGIRVELSMGAGEFNLMGDEERLGQVVSNLISNALKFTPRGGNIWLSLERLGSKLVLVCRDDGEGVDPAFLPNMFDRLKQEDMSTTRSHGGLGLGLAICAHIVQEHGGDIRAHSDGKGMGLSVFVTLPASAHKAPSKAARAEVPAQDLKGIRVLVVDDSHDILDLVHFWLGRAGAEVRLAESAATALKTLSEFRPDVILSDIGMPSVDGYQLITAIRKLPPEKGGQVPAAALTAYARDEERILALKAGFQIHIPKPINSSDLITAVAVLARA